MPQKKSKFHYRGPVYRNDKYICDWEGDTWAPSDNKALSNLSYRYKTQNNLLPGSNIKLDADYLYEMSAVDDEGIYHQMTLEEYANGIHTD